VRQRFWDDITKGVNHHMLNRFATLAAMCMLVPAGTAPSATADPNSDPPATPVADTASPPDADAAPLLDNGVVASAEPGILTTPEGWTLTVSGKDETELPMPPLTTALSSREYLVGGTFTGSVTGKGGSTLTGGTLEAGYQIGCGINSGNVKPAERFDGNRSRQTSLLDDRKRSRESPLGDAEELLGDIEWDVGHVGPFQIGDGTYLNVRGMVSSNLRASGLIFRVV
jgi:hypothetical protein